MKGPFLSLGVATTLSVYWPEAEHGTLIARWPRLAAEVGATWDEHRRQVERHCALVERAGHGVNQTPGDVSGLEAFLRDKRIRSPSAQDLLAYPDLRTQPAMVPWPPACTSACWCGSGRKYKQCCRPHGLVLQGLIISVKVGKQCHIAAVEGKQCHIALPERRLGAGISAGREKICRCSTRHP